MEILSAEEAALRVRSVDNLALPLGPGQPPAFMTALGERTSFESLEVFSALLLGLYPLFTRPGVRLRSGFFGPAERALRAAGHDVHFVPADFRRFTAIAERMAPRVMATAAAPADADGRFSLSLHAGATVEELHLCGRDPNRLLIVEINRRLPKTLGIPPQYPHGLREDEIDILIETDQPIFSLPDAPPNAIHRAIAEHVRGFVRDGATLQTGIGAIPNAVVSLLAEGPGGDYGIHSEMFTDGLMRLVESGKVTNRKGAHDGYAITTFAMGSEALYEWLDEREDVRFLPVSEVNTPALIAHNRNFVSINGAISVDLAGQIVADTLGSIQYSGIGGHEDFVAGAAFSHDGRSIVCLPSVAQVGDQPVSRILATVPPGSMVTTPRHQVDIVITEHGTAELAGLTVEERMHALAAIAHPEFRKDLEAYIGQAAD